MTNSAACCGGSALVMIEIYSIFYFPMGKFHATSFLSC